MSVTVPPGWGDPTVIPELLAERIIESANASASAQSLPPLKLQKEYLSNAISEITPETQTMGAALLQLTLIDPAWQIQRSGICDVDTDGLLYQVDINFPEGTEVWWRLEMVDGGNDLTQPNLTLTFQHRIVSYLGDCWGPMGWPGGKTGTTRAQFIKALADVMPHELPKPSLGPGTPPGIRFICPDLNVIQPIATTSTTGTQVIPPGQVNPSTGLNKQPAVTAATKITIKGAQPTATQLQVINAALGAGKTLNAPTSAMVAIIYAGMGESSLGADAGSVDNVWQANNPGNYGANPNWAEMATAFYQGIKDFAAPGAIAAANRGDQPWMIANETENNLAWIQSKSDSYAHQWPGGQAQGIAEATAIVNAFGGGALATPGSTPTTSDVAQLARGTADNPDEDSWACMQRLATEVNWMIFSSPCPQPGVFGNYLYLIDGPTAAAQKPRLYLQLSPDGTTWSATDPDTGKVVAEEGVITSLKYTVDNTAFTYQQTRKVKGKTQRATRIRTPQTPSHFMFNMLCGALEFDAGQVFVVHDGGPLNGRWIVEDVTHNILGDLFAQFTLGPPTMPYPEPQSGAVTVLGLNGQPVLINPQSPNPSAPGSPSGPSTGLAGAANIAQQALARERSQHCFHYQQLRPIQYDILTASPVFIDCSGFVIACYKAAGLHDPSNNNYNGSGFTGDMITNCHKITLGSAQPGDMIFYGTPTPYHVVIYIGNGQCVSMGQEGDPSQGPWDQMGAGPPSGIYRTNFAIPTGPSKPATTTQPPIPSHTTPDKTGPSTPSNPPTQRNLTGIFTGLF